MEVNNPIITTALNAYGLNTSIKKWGLSKTKFNPITVLFIKQTQKDKYYTLSLMRAKTC